MCATSKCYGRLLNYVRIDPLRKLRGREAAEGRVRTIMALKLIEALLKFGAAREEFARQKFVAELAKKALDMSVLPGRPGLDEVVVHRCRQRERAKLRAVVRANSLRLAEHQKKPL